MPTANVHKVYQICRHCDGDGYLEYITQEPGQEPVIEQKLCPNCNGHTVYLWGYITEDTAEITVP